MTTRKEVQKLIDDLKPDIKVFKSIVDTNYSLTTDGFYNFVKLNVEKQPFEFEHKFTGLDLIKFNKLIATVYYYNPITNRVFHYDSEMQFLRSIYIDNFSQYLRDASVTEKFQT